MNWLKFFNMGGYAFEVWTCWGLSGVTLVFFIISYKRANAKIRQQIAREMKREKQFSQTN